MSRGTRGFSVTVPNTSECVLETLALLTWTVALCSRTISSFSANICLGSFNESISLPIGLLSAQWTKPPRRGQKPKACRWLGIGRVPYAARAGRSHPRQTWAWEASRSLLTHTAEFSRKVVYSFYPSKQDGFQFFTDGFPWLRSTFCGTTPSVNNVFKRKGTNISCNMVYILKAPATPECSHREWKAEVKVWHWTNSD